MVKIKKVRPWAKIPVLGTCGAAAFDVHYCSDDPGFNESDIVLRPGSVVKVGTGLAFELPLNLAMLILPRSGLATKERIRPANTPGLLDSDYRGELFIALENCGVNDFRIGDGQRIAQILFVPIARPLSFEVVDELTSTERGDGGFGSTGA